VINSPGYVGGRPVDKLANHTRADISTGASSYARKDEGFAVNEITQSTMSFDRMRTMLVRAAEIRESEQQQIFDALDEIHARLSPLESLGSMRKRLAEVPDRTEIGVLAERLDETVAKLDSQDAVIASLGRAVEAIVDKLAKPFAQLDGRLEGVAGRFEGVAGRMDGLEDKLSSIHRRIDELDLHLDKQDTKVDALPREINSNTKDRLDALDIALDNKIRDLDANVREQLEATTTSLGDTRSELGDTRAELSKKLTAQTEELQGALAETTDVLHNKLAETHTAATDSSKFDTMTERLEKIATTIEAVTERLDTVETDFGSKLGEVSTSVDGKFDALSASVDNKLGDLSTSVESKFGDLSTSVDNKLGDLSTSVSSVGKEVATRPDAEALDSLVRKANSESERRNAGQLDEAMATFAELILGGGSPNMAATPALPKQARRRNTKARTNGAAPKEEEDSSVS
jgi:chromosome segregation ATPase